MKPKERSRVQIDALVELIAEMQREIDWWHERFPAIAQEKDAA